MTTRRMAWLSGLTLAAAGGISACSKPAAPSSDLSRDLDAASAAPALTLAPTSGRRDVISAVERSPEARQAPARSTTRLVAHRSPPVATPPVQVAAPTPQPTPATTVAAMPSQAAPATTPATISRRPAPVSQAHGRYKTEAEVFRDAPFPITP